MEISSIIKSDFLKFDAETTVSEMIGLLKKYEKKSGLVFKNNKYLGLIEKKHLLRTKLDATSAKLKNFIQASPLLEEHADVVETAYLMYQSDNNFLPVVRNKVIIGVINGLDVAKLATELPELEGLKTSDVKFIKSLAVQKDDPLSKVTLMMHKQKTDTIPIINNGVLYGLISYRDIIRKYLNWSPQRNFSTKFNKIASTRSAEADMPNLANLPISSFSTNDNLVTVSSKNSLKEAINLMVKNNHLALPVVDGDKLEGVLTLKNILRIVGSLKIPVNYNIQFVGLNDLKLEKYDQQALQKICANEALKLQRAVNNENFSLHVHLKRYEKDGNRCKYAVNMRVEFPGRIVSISQDDWDWRTAVRKTFANAKNKVQKIFKSK